MLSNLEITELNRYIWWLIRRTNLMNYLFLKLSYYLFKYDSVSTIRYIMCLYIFESIIFNGKKRIHYLLYIIYLFELTNCEKDEFLNAPYNYDLVCGFG